MGDFPSRLVTTPARPLFGRVKAAVIGVVLAGLCLTLAGATSAPVVDSPAFLIAGMRAIPAPPAGSSWAPAPVDVNGLTMVAGTDSQRFELHTVAGARSFLPGVNLGGTTPGHQSTELSISAAQYRAWFAAMGWLGIRVVRIATIHPPAFYQQLVAHNRTNPARPLYLLQGVRFPDESGTATVKRELAKASDAVAGKLSNWDTDATAWLVGWLIGADPDPAAVLAFDRGHPGTPAVHGRYFRSTADATPTERRLAGWMENLATEQAKKGLSQPIAFVNRMATDPLRHPGDLVQVDANHVRPTADWPAGTFAGYALRDVQDGEYLAALRGHHPDMPTLITGFGVPSAIGSAGDHREQEAMAINAELLRLIHDQGLAAGFLAGWTDDWSTTAGRRSLWHDPLTGEQHHGLLAMEAAGRPGAPAQMLGDTVSARVDESYLTLRVTPTGSRPGVLTIGFDVLPALTGNPFPGTDGDRTPDAAFTLDLAGHTGQAYLRDTLAAGRPGAGLLRYGTWDPADAQADSRALWHIDGADLVVRAPWAMLGFSDPSSHRAGPSVSPGVTITLSPAGRRTAVGQVTWPNWNRPYYTERLKQGAELFRDAALSVTDG